MAITYIYSGLETVIFSFWLPRYAIKKVKIGFIRRTSLESCFYLYHLLSVYRLH